MMPDDKKQREIVRQRCFRASILYHQKDNIVVPEYPLKGKETKKRMNESEAGSQSGRVKEKTN